MKLTKQELINKINNTVTDVDLAISLIEDVSDSMEETSVDVTEVEALKSKVDELTYQLDDMKERYKARFLTSEETEENETPTEENEETEEDEVVDIKEI